MKAGFFPLDWHSKFLTLQELSYHYLNNGVLANFGTYLAISYLLIDILSRYLYLQSNSANVAFEIVCLVLSNRSQLSYQE